MSTEIDYTCRSCGNINRHKKKTMEFLATNPVCSCCGEKLTHFSRIMLCEQCRNHKNYQAFLARNPGYQKWYQHERWLNRNNENKSNITI